MALHVDIRSPIATGAPRAIQPLGASPLELLLGFGDPWEVTVARVLAIHATIASAELYVLLVRRDRVARQVGLPRVRRLAARPAEAGEELRSELTDDMPNIYYISS